MNIFKRIRRRLAIIFVTWWAQWAYKKGVKAAERRRLALLRSPFGNGMVYLAVDSWHPDRLITYTKSQFKAEKRVYGQAARLLTMTTLKRGCFYHTSDRWGREGLSERDVEIRRKAFIRGRLRLAKLI